MSHGNSVRRCGKIYTLDNRDELTLILPWPPSVNAMWRAVPRRGVLLSKRGRQYRQAAVAAIANQTFGIAPTQARLAVLMDVYPPDRRKRDISNIPKAIEDAITVAASVWCDDEQVDDLHIIRRERWRGGKVVVHIRKITES